MDTASITVIIVGAAVVVAIMVMLRAQSTRAVAAAETATEKLAKISGQLQQSETSLNRRMEALTTQLGTSLTQQTEKTGERLKGLGERLAVIDSAQKNITDLSQQVVNLQDILSNKQARGAFGKMRLEDMVRDALPPNAYGFEVTLSNGKRVDCLVKLPSPPGSIPIDSKFPLEAYRAMQKAGNETEKKQAERAFSRDVGNHVKDIANKYIIAGETADWAIMYLPSEAIFAEILTNFPNITKEAHRRHVGITSPATMMGMINTIRAILKDARMHEQAGLIQIEVEKMLNDVRLLGDRVKNLKTHFRLANEDIDKIETSSGNITDRGQKIKDAQLGDDTGTEKLPPPKDEPKLREV